MTFAQLRLDLVLPAPLAATGSLGEQGHFEPGRDLSQLAPVRFEQEQLFDVPERSR
jgi:hypothetical protein